MKYLITICVCIGLCQSSYAQSKRVHFGLTPEINYAFIEGKHINDDSFNKRLSIGFGITAPVCIKLNDNNTIVTGIKMGFYTYNFDFSTINQVSQNIGASLPINFEHQLSKRWLVGLGTNLSWHGAYINTFDVYTPSQNLLSSVIFEGHNVISTPVKVYLGHSFYSKKGRKSDLLLTFQKGIRSQETVTLLNYAGAQATNSTFDDRSTHFAIGYRLNFGQ